MSGPAGVMALLLAETVTGGIVFLFSTPLWHEVKLGFFKLGGAVVLALGLAAYGSMHAGLIPGDAAGLWSLRLCEALTAATALWLLLSFLRRPAGARILGIATIPLALAMLVTLSGTADGSRGFAFFQLAVGAAMLGAVMDGLLLGHWYLTERGLARGPINRASTILVVAVVAKAVVVVLGGFGPTQGAAAFNPLLTSAGLAPWISLGMVAATLTIAVLIRLTLKGPRASAVQAATGFFYLAVLTAFTAELATLVSFLPPSR